jgi:two-component system, sensor histidine kinase and response regulator
VPPTEKNRFAGRKLLVVEDSRTQAEYLTHLLLQEGYMVVQAGHGREALDAIRNDPPALVLTDIIMPEMDGYELCRAIRADPAIAQVPVILVTQLYDPADVLKGLEAGADNFIVKPYDPEQVYSQVISTLEMAGRPDPDGPQSGFTMEFARQKHTIPAGRSRILSILLSTYEFAVRKNIELEQAHERMSVLNEELSALNEELTASVEDLQQANLHLTEENAVRGRVEKALADANRKLNLMTSITRHDINNQILALQAYIDLAEMEITDPSILQYIQKARIASHTIQKQIAFTKHYEDIGVTAPQWQEIRKIVWPLQDYLKGAGIVLECCNMEIAVYADPLLSKVFENLVDNSIRHGRRVQRITVNMTRLEDGGACIAYQDDGEGVADTDKENIFRKGFGKNTGLGLFLGREILGITGITIRERGVFGTGACFEIMVPPEGVRVV